MKYTPIIAALAVIAGLATAFQVDARNQEPRYNLDFAFGTDASMRVEVRATDTFHVVARRGKVSYEVNGTTVSRQDKIVAKITIIKESGTPVEGPNHITADSIKKDGSNSVVYLTPNGAPVPMGGSQSEQFTVALSRTESR